jgi:hypothetical protein
MFSRPLSNAPATMQGFIRMEEYGMIGWHTKRTREHISNTASMKYRVLLVRLGTLPPIWQHKPTSRSSLLFRQYGILTTFAFPAESFYHEPNRIQDTPS